MTFFLLLYSWLIITSQHSDFAALSFFLIATSFPPQSLSTSSKVNANVRVFWVLFFSDFKVFSMEIFLGKDSWQKQRWVWIAGMQVWPNVRTKGPSTTGWDISSVTTSKYSRECITPPGHSHFVTAKWNKF